MSLDIYNQWGCQDADLTINTSALRFSCVSFILRIQVTITFMAMMILLSMLLQKRIWRIFQSMVVKEFYILRLLLGIQCLMVLHSLKSLLHVVKTRSCRMETKCPAWFQNYLRVSLHSSGWQSREGREPLQLNARSSPRWFHCALNSALQDVERKICSNLWSHVLFSSN